MIASGKSPSRKGRSIRIRASEPLTTEEYHRILAGKTQSDDSPLPWEVGSSVERLALLFDDGGLLVAEVDGTIDGESVAAIRTDLPKAGRLGRVRVAVLEVEPAQAPAERLPASVVEILRHVRNTPNLLSALRAELDRVIAGAAP